MSSSLYSLKRFFVNVTIFFLLSSWLACSAPTYPSGLPTATVDRDQAIAQGCQDPIPPLFLKNAEGGDSLWHIEFVKILPECGSKIDTFNGSSAFTCDRTPPSCFQYYLKYKTTENVSGGRFHSYMLRMALSSNKGAFENIVISSSVSGNEQEGIFDKLAAPGKGVTPFPEKPKSNCCAWVDIMVIKLNDLIGLPDEVVGAASFYRGYWD